MIPAVDLPTLRPVAGGWNRLAAFDALRDAMSQTADPISTDTTPPVPQLQPSPPPLTPPVDEETASSASSSTTTNGPTGGIKPEHSPAKVDPGASSSSHGGGTAEYPH
jgi:hypothetical protein